MSTRDPLETHHARIRKRQEAGSGLGRELAGKKVILTGATSGIGKAILNDLVAAGCEVLAASRHAVELGNRESYPRSVKFLDIDVTSEAALMELARLARSFLNEVDLLINNAGRIHRELLTASSLEDWNAVVDTNLTGAFLMLKHVLPIMTEQGHGVVINIGSAEAVNCTPGLASYSASKSALAALTRSAAREMRHCPGVIIVGLLPGDIRTAMNPTGSEDPTAAVRRLRELLAALEPRHSGTTYVQGRFAVPSLAFLSD